MRRKSYGRKRGHKKGRKGYKKARISRGGIRL